MMEVQAFLQFVQLRTPAKVSLDPGVFKLRPGDHMWADDLFNPDCLCFNLNSSVYLQRLAAHV